MRELVHRIAQRIVFVLGDGGGDGVAQLRSLLAEQRLAPEVAPHLRVLV